MDIQKAIKLLEQEYERAKKSPFVQKPLAWALYQTWRRVDRGLLKKIPKQPTAPTLMPMGALTYSIACSHCTHRKGSPLCDDCICEVTSWFELDPDTRPAEPGIWLAGKDDLGIDRGWKCSVCGGYVYEMTHEPYQFCPHCGAPMNKFEVSM